MAHCDRLLFCLLCGAHVSCYMAGSRLIRTRNGDFRVSPFKVRFLFKERVEKTCREGGDILIIVLSLLFVSRYVQFNPLRTQTALLCVFHMLLTTNCDYFPNSINRLQFLWSWSAFPVRYEMSICKLTFFPHAQYFVSCFAEFFLVHFISRV